MIDMLVEKLGEHNMTRAAMNLTPQLPIGVLACLSI